jgi:putative spermidine/putrescine transport system ATP-binding protein
VIDTEVVSREGALPTVRIGSHDIVARASEPVAVGAAVKLAVRPENVVIEPVEGPIRLPATVVRETYQGPIVRYVLTVEGQEIVCERQNQAGVRRYAPGASVTIGWAPERSELLAG